MRRGWKAAVVAMLMAAGGAQAATWYVATNGSDAAAGTSWTAAKQTIQAAIDLAVSNDVVLVSNGVYAAGGRVVYGALTNRIAITNAITVQSINGAGATVIVGAKDPATTNGDAAVRCAYVGSNAVLSGFTLMGGATRAAGDSYREQSGGGALCASNALVSNCVIAQNDAAWTGGGCMGGQLSGCTIIRNNSGFSAGGVHAFFPFKGGLTNCIIYYNRAAKYYDNFWPVNVSLSYCCTAPDPGGVGNLTNAPLIAGVANPHLLGDSPCIGAGLGASAVGTDLDGGARVVGGSVDIGCDEFAPPLIGPLSAQILAPLTDTVCGLQVFMEAVVGGVPEALAWDWGDGAVTTNLFFASHAFSTPGTYDIVLRVTNASGGVAATVTVQVAAQPVVYVAPGGAHVPPFMNWTAAATNIQAAIDSAPPGALVLVSNGVYASGGRVVLGGLTNRIAITNALSVRSVNGPSVTTIRGRWDPVTTNGSAAVRCAYVGTNASLIGFALTDGATRNAGIEADGQGGGAWCEDSALVSNCVVSGNVAYGNGGGTRGGVLKGCLLAGNAASSARGGGSFGGWQEDCVYRGNAASYGGASASGQLSRCQLISNSATYGGAVLSSTLNNCLLLGNVAGWGGGSCSGILKNCTIVWNTATGSGGGAAYDRLYNCIAYDNTAPSGSNHFEAALTCCDTLPLPTNGAGNISDRPLLAGASNPHLLAASPCVDAGTNAWAIGTDLDGEPRIANGRVDIGCDEYAAPATGPLSVQIRTFATNFASGYRATFEALITGAPDRLTWGWGDGQGSTNEVQATHAYATTGVYTVTLLATNGSGGAMATVAVEVSNITYYVAPGGGHVPPFASWATAATSIQAAVDVAAPGNLILVSNGVYGTGGRVMYGAMTNRVAITNSLRVASVNGPEATFLVGARDPLTTNGDAAVRGVYVGAGASLIGFTVSNGATRSSGEQQREQSGGGIWCETEGAVSNCVLSGNTARDGGGGVFGGALARCRFTGNRASLGGGAREAKLEGCELIGNAGSWGGGVYLCELSNCLLACNAASRGGGSYNSTMVGCTLASNSVSESVSYGGGSFGGTLTDCLLVGNTAAGPGGCHGGGAYGGYLLRCRLCWNSCSASTGNGGACRGSSLTNCLLEGNSAAAGGGAFESTLFNCLIVSNAAAVGGGVHGSWLHGCTVVWNRAQLYGGGARSGGALDNCIVYHNAAPTEPNLSSVAANHCCTVPLPGSGSGHVTNEPLLASVGNPHLLRGSPCVEAGDPAHAFGLDWDQEARVIGSMVDIGCDEQALDLDGALTVAAWAAHTNVAVGFPVDFEMDVQGVPATLRWCWGDGTETTNLFRAAHAFPAAGDYVVVARATNDSDAAAATVTVQVVETVYHVAPGGGHVPPFTNWLDAATNIQAAIDVAVPGGLVLVSNGVYDTGGRVVYGALTNRVALTLPVSVRSVSGPAATFIVGAWDPVTTNGDAAIRCAYVGSNALLSGFTLTSGAVRAVTDTREKWGGGAWCETNGAVSNCVVAGCAAVDGGGIAQGRLFNSTLAGNRAGSGGGALYTILWDCVVTGNVAASGGGLFRAPASRSALAGNTASANGGGAGESPLSACVLLDNAAGRGGGADYCDAVNCVLAGNRSGGDGGGAYYGTLVHCTLTGNTASNCGGGAYCGTLNNSVLYFNQAAQGYSNYCGSTLSFCCTTPQPGGAGNVTNEPLFVATNDFHLAAGSPCIDAGSVALVSATNDLDGLPRVRFGGVDMGAYEFQTPLGYWAWAAAITNGATGYSQSATGDGRPNLLKYAMGQDATNAGAMSDLFAVWAAGGFGARFLRNTNATDVTLIVEGAAAAADGAPWTGLATNRAGSWGGATNVAEEGTTSPAAVTVRAGDEASTNTFLRLRVTRP